MAITQKESSRNYYIKNKKSLIFKAKQYRAKKLLEDPSWLSRQIKKRKLINPEKFKEWSKSSWVRTRFGIEKEQYDALLVSQGMICKICNINLNDKNKALDHCHKTGKIRSFLCKKCNSGMGYFDDNPDIVMKAYKYLSGEF